MTESCAVRARGVTKCFGDVGAATGAAIYQLDVNPNGRYVADGDGPQEVNGYFILHAPAGDAPNPLWQFDGLIDLLVPPSKG